MKRLVWGSASGGVIVAALVAASLLAGCFQNEATPKDDEERPLQIFELNLYPLGKAGPKDLRWQLYPGAKVEAWAFAPEGGGADAATIPGPEIRVTEGDRVRVTFNIFGAPMPHTIHWHGLHVPWDMDGVPYVSQKPLGDPMFGGTGNKSFTYEFNVTGQSGTYWYHCHVDTQHHLDMGMYGAFIVEPKDPKQDPAFDQEATLMFDEWDKSHVHGNPTTESLGSPSGDPLLTLEGLPAQLRDWYHMVGLTTLENVYDRARNATAANGTAPKDALRQNRTWYPVTYPAYFADYDTFLINGKAFPDTEPIKVQAGKTIRLRLINAGNFPHAIHLHGHHMLVTHTDGYLLSAPYHKDTLLIAPGERYDVYVKLDNPGPWMLHDHMSQYEQNDHISPGGMSTTLCYTDGWAFAEKCVHGHIEVPHTNEQVVAGMSRLLRYEQGGEAAPEYAHH